MKNSNTCNLTASKQMNFNKSFKNKVTNYIYIYIYIYI